MTEETKKLVAYVDASGKYSNASDTILTVNGCLSTPDKWEPFSAKWQSYLKSKGFTPHPETGSYYFHTSLFQTDNFERAPKNLSPNDKSEIYFHLMDLIREFTLFRFGYGVVLDDFRQIEKEFPMVRDAHIKSPGTYASMRCFKWNSVWAVNNGYDSSIEYVFDHGDEFWSELSTWYNNASKRSDPLTAATLQCAKKNEAKPSPLDAADIIAWEARRYFANLLKGHLLGLITRPRPSKAMRRLGCRNGTVANDIRLYSYDDMVGELREDIDFVVDRNPKLQAIVGECKPFATRDDFARAMFALDKEKREAKSEAKRNAWRARKKAKRKHRTITGK